jgi:diguanylate cyclase (GGDEF)-like protein
MARVRRAIDVAAVSGATFAVTWQMLLSPSLHGSHAADALMAAVLAAPEVLAAAVALVTMAGNLPTRDSRALHLLATAAIVLAVTVLLAWHNIRTGAAWYAQGVGGGYIFAAGVMAVASRHGVPPAAPAGVRRHVSGAWALLPYVPIMLAVAAAASAQVRTGSLEPMLVWVLLATFCLVVLRQFLTLATVAKMAIKLEQQQRVLAHQAHHDPLTGLPNRAAFHDAADAVLAEPARRVTVMLLDLDGFKPVNDTLGHAAGDAVLVQTAHRLVAAVRPGDLVARLGGDEFVILLEGADSGIGTAVARRVLSVIAEPMTVDGTTVRVGCSVGLTARPPGQSETVSSLLSQADMAMYAAKAAGKGAIRCHEPARASMLV